MKKIVLSSLIALFVFSSTFNGYAVTTTSSTNASATTETKEVPAVTSVSDALKEFRNLSRKERKERLKEAKKEIKQYKLDRKSGAEPSTNTLLLVILAILLPPLAVYLHQGEINSKFWIALVLTLLFILPGIIYALLVVLGNA